jgi:ribosome-associated protein
MSQVTQPTNRDVLATLETAVSAASEMGARDQIALSVTEQFGLADVFLIVSGDVERSVLAIAREIEDHINDSGVRTIRREGRESGRWVLLDFGDLIVHVFHQEERDFYQLERLWSECPSIDVDAWIDNHAVVGAEEG